MRPRCSLGNGSRRPFQIPMRGNESVFPFLRATDRSAFQIPMRGNEMKIYGWDDVGVARSKSP